MAYAEWNETAYYEPGDVVQYQGTLTLYIAQVSNINIPPLPPNPTWVPASLSQFPLAFGSWYSQTSQPLVAGNKLAFTYDAAGLVGPGIAPVGAYPTPTLEVAATGVYKVSASVQWDKTGGGGTNNFQLWITINGADVPWTSTEIDITQQINDVMTIEWLLSLNATDQLAVVGYMAVGGVNGRITAYPIGPTHPVDIPSIITNIYRIA